MKQAEIKGRANKAVRKFLRSKRMRSYQGYTLEFKHTEYGLECQTWGYDYATLIIPKTWQELVRCKMRFQMRALAPGADGYDKVGYRLYYEMMRN